MTPVRLACALLAIAALAGAVIYVAGLSDARPPPDHAIRFVPANATAYVHLTTDADDDQYDRARKAVSKLPSFSLLRGQLLAEASAGGRLDLAAAARDWLGAEAAYAEVPGGRAQRLPAIARGSLAGASVGVKRALVARRSDRLLVLAVRDERAAARAISGKGFVLNDGFVLAGRREVVLRALEARRGRLPSLDEDPTYAGLTSQLPAERFANAFARTGALLSGSGATAADALRFLGGGRLDAIALAIGTEGSTGRLAARADGAEAGTGRCAEGSGAEPQLIKDAPASTAALVEFADAGCAAQRLRSRRDSGPARTLERFARAARTESRLSFNRDLAPLADGPGELLVTGADAPVLTLILDDVEGRTGLQRMDRLQPALIKLVGSEGLGRVPSFGARELGAITAITSELSPGLELSYAQIGSRFAVSTQPDGIRAAAADGGLTSTEGYRRVLGDIPGKPSSVVFLDLDRLLALGDQVGLSDDAGLLAIRDDLQRLAVVGASFTRDGRQTNAEIRFNIP